MESAKGKYEVLEAVSHHLSSVGRIANRGSCVLISRPASDRAVLLTTSAAISDRYDATGLHATFYEQPVCGTTLKKLPTAPISVWLRPERLFFSSVSGEGLGADQQLGYTVVGCDVQSGLPDNAVAKPEIVSPRAINPPQFQHRNSDSAFNTSQRTSILSLTSPTHPEVEKLDDRQSLLRTPPLYLPLLCSKVPKVCSGDKHLIISHPLEINAAGTATEPAKIERQIYWYTVDNVYDSHCNYEDVDDTTLAATGGAVFDHNGEFVGIHHQQRETCYTIFIADIVRHLYDTTVLGHIGIPILDNEKPPSGDLSDTASGLRKAPIQLRPADASIVLDYGLLQQHVRLAREATHNFKETLKLRNVKEIWQEYYKKDDYRSLVLMLFAFHKNSTLLQRILEAMISHEHRRDVSQLASLGGVGILLEALEKHPYDENVMIAGLTAVGRVSLFPQNRDALSLRQGVETILGLLQEYRNTDEAAQWGVYALLNLVQETPHAAENADGFVGLRGIELIIDYMKKFPNSRHGHLWGMQLISYVIGSNKQYFDYALEAGILTLVHDSLSLHGTDELVVNGIFFLTQALTQSTVFEGAANYFSKIGDLKRIVSLLEVHQCARDPSVLWWGISTVRNICSLDPTSLEILEECSYESALSQIAMKNMSDAQLHRLIVKAMVSIGINDPEGRHPHLQPAHGESCIGRNA